MYSLLIELIKPMRIIRVLGVLLTMYFFLPCASKNSLFCVFYVILVYAFWSLFVFLAISSLFEKVLKTKGLKERFEFSFPVDDMYSYFRFLVELPEERVSKILSDLDLDCMFLFIMWLRARYYDGFLAMMILFIIAIVATI